MKCTHIIVADWNAAYEGPEVEMFDNAESAQRRYHYLMQSGADVYLTSVISASTEISRRVAESEDQ